jgi:hypothetical protein
MEETYKLQTNRVLYPHGSWFPLKSEVFKSVLPTLRKNRSPHLYLAMYEFARHKPSKSFSANLTDLGKMIDCDLRTARSCIIELVENGFVDMVEIGGDLRSRTDKAKFRVPLADENLDHGFWFPVPKFLVTEYMPTYTGSVLLVSMLYHQHMGWNRYGWAGVTTLSKELGMKKRRVFDYMHTMGHEHLWKRLGTGLPWPLEITYSPDRETRRFSVRAAQYYLPFGRKKRVVKLQEEFAAHFGYQNKTSVDDDERD